MLLITQYFSWRCRVKKCAIKENNKILYGTSKEIFLKDCASVFHKFILEMLSDVMNHNILEKG